MALVTSKTTEFTLGSLGVSGNTPKFTLTDTSDYAGEGIALSDVKGIFKITGPCGTVYENTNFGSPDITGNVSLVFDGVDMPVDSDGNPIKGSYTIIMTTRVAGGVEPGDYTSTTTYDFEFDAPSVSITVEADCLAAQLTSTDQTEYTVSGITPTITRSHKVDFQDHVKSPEASGTGSVILIGYPYFYTGEYTTNISSVLSYTVATGVTITVTVTGSKVFSADCDQNICSVSCGIINLNNAYKNALGKNTALANQYNEQLERISFLVGLFSMAIKCGRISEAQAALIEIKSIGQFQDNCGGTSPVRQIIPLAGTGVVIVAAGTGITVSSSAGGGTTTYTVSLEATLKAKIDNLIKTLISAGSNITVTPSTSGYTTTYTIAFSGSIPNNPNIYSTEITFSYNAVSNFPTVTCTDIVTQSYGDVFKTGTPRTPTITASNLGAGQSAQYAITAFKSVSGASKRFSTTLSVLHGFTVIPYKPQILGTSTSEVDMFWLDNNNNPVTYQAINNWMAGSGQNIVATITLIGEPT